MPKPWPVLKTDEEAEHFVATADLTEYDVGAMRRVRFDFTSGKGVSIHDAATGELLLPRPDGVAVESAMAAPAPPPAE